MYLGLALHFTVIDSTPLNHCLTSLSPQNCWIYNPQCACMRGVKAVAFDSILRRMRQLID